MPKKVFCENDCEHNKNECTFSARAGIIIVGAKYDHGCDEYKKKECKHSFKCTKCGEEVQE